MQLLASASCHPSEGLTLTAAELTCALICHSVRRNPLILKATSGWVS